VPWADGDTGFTRPFEDMVAYLAQRTDKTTVTRLMRIAWATVGRIIERVVERLRPGDPLADLKNIGIDELSYRRHHEYVTIVTDHDKGHVVWAEPGKNAATAKRFFDDLGAERTSELRVVTMDMSEAYKTAVTEAAPNARIVFDRFHVQRLAHDALDTLRRQQWVSAAWPPSTDVTMPAAHWRHDRDGDEVGRAGSPVARERQDGVRVRPGPGVRSFDAAVLGEPAQSAAGGCREACGAGASAPRPSGGTRGGRRADDGDGGRRAYRGPGGLRPRAFA
jgi:transposase-like protein